MLRLYCEVFLQGGPPQPLRRRLRPGSRLEPLDFEFWGGCIIKRTETQKTRRRRNFSLVRGGSIRSLTSRPLRCDRLNVWDSVRLSHLDRRLQPQAPSAFTANLEKQYGAEFVGPGARAPVFNFGPWVIRQTETQNQQGAEF